MHVYLMKQHILRRDLSRLFFKVKGQMYITVEPSEEETLYLSMHVHLMKAHILTDDMSRSMSPFTYRCQIHRFEGGIGSV